MRNNMVTTLAEDYVRMARAKGLPAARIMLDYAARNAILPNLTGFAMSLGFVVSGAILIEYVFNYPGVGYMLLQAVENEDYPLMQALFLLITVAVLVAILLADIAPRSSTRAPGRRGDAMADPDYRRPCRAGADRRRAARRAPRRLWRAVARQPQSDRRRRSCWSSSCLLALFPGLIAHDNPNAEIYEPQPRAVAARTCSAPPRYGQDIFAQLVWGTRQVLISRSAPGCGHRDRGDHRRGRRLPGRIHGTACST